MQTSATVIITGCLGKDPFRVVSKDGKTFVVKFTMATNKTNKKTGEFYATWYQVTCFGKSAELIETSYKKGEFIQVIGELYQVEFTDKAGQKKSALQVDMDRFIFLNNSKNSNSTVLDEDIPF